MSILRPEGAAAVPAVGGAPTHIVATIFWVAVVDPLVIAVAVPTHVLPRPARQRRHQYTDDTTPDTAAEYGVFHAPSIRVCGTVVDIEIR